MSELADKERRAIKILRMYRSHPHTFSTYGYVSRIMQQRR